MSAVSPNRRSHSLKTDPAVFQAVLEGRKTYEIRLNDRDFQESDELILRETRYSVEEMHAGAPREYTERELHKVISHVLRGPVYGLADGWAILSFEEERGNKPSADALDLLWKEVILAHKPNYGDWEYPGQAYRHLLAEFNDLRLALSAATARGLQLAAELERAAEVFDSYAMIHEAKGTPAGNLKAQTNRRHAADCRAILATEGGDRAD